MKKEKLILAGAVVHTEQGELRGKAIVIEQGGIQQIISVDDIGNKYFLSIAVMKITPML